MIDNLLSTDFIPLGMFCFVLVMLYFIYVLIFKY